MAHVEERIYGTKLRLSGQQTSDGRRCTVAIQRRGTTRAAYAPTLPEAFASLLGDGYVLMGREERRLSRVAYARTVLADLRTSAGMGVHLALDVDEPAPGLASVPTIVVRTGDDWAFGVSMSDVGVWNLIASV